MNPINIVRNGDTRLVRIVDGEVEFVRVISEGPQGPAGPGAMTDLVDVDITAVTNRSTLIYDAGQQKWIGNVDTTVDEILNGGNF